MYTKFSQLNILNFTINIFPHEDAIIKKMSTKIWRIYLCLTVMQLISKN